MSMRQPQNIGVTVRDKRHRARESISVNRLGDSRLNADREVDMVAVFVLAPLQEGVSGYV
jgi:hypothetical protein